MTAIAVQQQGHAPAPVLLVHLVQKRLEIFCTLPMADLEQAVARGQIHAAKYGPSCIPVAQSHLCRHAPQGPHSAQRWKQQQVRFILRQHDAALGQAANYAPDTTLFFLVARRQPRHSAAVSRHSQAGAVSAV